MEGTSEFGSEWITLTGSYPDRPFRAAGFIANFDDWLIVEVEDQIFQAMRGRAGRSVERVPLAK